MSLLRILHNYAVFFFFSKNILFTAFQIHAASPEHDVKLLTSFTDPEFLNGYDCSHAPSRSVALSILSICWCLRIWKWCSRTSATADRRANVDVPIPQVAGGVFTPDGLYESGRDCVTSKTGKSTAEYAGTIQVGQCDAYNRKYTTITSVTNPTLGAECRSRFSILLVVFVITPAVENLHILLDPKDFQRSQILYARLFWTRLGLWADIVQNTCC